MSSALFMLVDFTVFSVEKKNIPNSLIYSLSFQHTFIVFTESIENVVEKAPSVGADMIIIRLLMLNTVFFFFSFETRVYWPKLHKCFLVLCLLPFGSLYVYLLSVHLLLS